MKSKFKLLLLMILIGLPVLIVGLIGVTLFLLNQPSIGEKAVHEGVQRLQDENFHLSYSAGSFALFKGFAFNDLRIELHRPESHDIKITIEKIEAGYSLTDLLHGEVNIDFLRIVHPRIEGEVFAGNETPIEAAAEESFALPAWLRRLRIGEFSVKNSQINLKIVEGETRQTLAINDLSAAMNLLFEFSDGFQAQGSLQTAVAELRYGENELKALQVKMTVDSSSLKARVSEEGAELATASLQLQNTPNLKGRLQVKAVADPQTLRLAALNDIGILRVSFAGEFAAERTAEQLLQINPDRWPLSLKLQGELAQDAGKIRRPLFAISPAELSIEFSQTARLERRAELRLAIENLSADGHKVQGLQANAAAGQDQEKWQAEIRSHAEKVISPFLKKPASLAEQLKLSGVADLSQVSLQAELSADGLSLMHLQADMADRDGKLQAKPRLQVFFGRQWAFSLDQALLQRIGQMNASFDGEARIQHGRKSWLELDAEEIEKSDLSLRLQGELSQPSAVKSQADFTFKQPVYFSLQAEQKGGVRSARMNLGLVEGEAKGLATVKDLAWQAQVELPGKINTQLTLNNLILQKELHEELQQDMPLGRLRMSAAASVDPAGPFVLENFKATFAQNLLALQAQGKGDAKVGDMTLNGDLRADTRGGFSQIPGLEVKGDIEFPWSFVMRKNRTVEIDGRMQLSDVSLRMGENFLRNMSGAIVLKESLVNRRDEWQLAKVLNRNPFERVDFDRFQPFLLNTEPLVIKSIGFAGIEVGPLSGFFSLRQNLLTAQKFYFRLRHGEMAGEVFADFYPGQRAFGALLRVSDLRPAEVIPPRILGDQTATDKPISGRVGLVYQISQGTVDGRMDITEIGKEQVLTMIDVLDPQLENENLNLARKGLAFGYPKGLFLSINQGVLDLDLNLGGLAGGALGQIHAPSIPVSGVVSSVSSDLEKFLK